jgi:hypothetical protein
MAAVARYDSMSLFGIDNLLSGYGTGIGPKTLDNFFNPPTRPLVGVQSLLTLPQHAQRSERLTRHSETAPLGSGIVVPKRRRIGLVRRTFSDKGRKTLALYRKRPDGRLRTLSIN